MFNVFSYIFDSSIVFHWLLLLLGLHSTALKLQVTHSQNIWPKSIDISDSVLSFILRHHASVEWDLKWGGDSDLENAGGGQEDVLQPAVDVSGLPKGEGGGGLRVLSRPNCPRACHDSQTGDRRGRTHQQVCVRLLWRFSCITIPRLQFWLSHKHVEIKCSPAGALPLIMQQWACGAASDQQMAASPFKLVFGWDASKAKTGLLCRCQVNWWYSSKRQWVRLI